MKTTGKTGQLSPATACDLNGLKGGLPDRWLKASEVAGLLGFQTRTIYKMAYQGRLPSSKVGRALRFSLSSLVRYMRDRERPCGA